MDTAARSHHSPTHIGFSILSLVALLGSTTPAPPDPQGSFTVIGSVNEMTRASAQRAVAIYQSAGIDLPHFYLREGCHPNDHAGGAGSDPRAWYSTTGHADGPTVTACHPACLRVMLHELAHHWDLTVLGEAHRDRMTRLLAVDTWLDPDAPYRDRGGERWANIVAWGLMPCDLLGKVESWGGDPTMYGLARDEAGDIFTRSTGVPPRHGFEFDPAGVCG